MQCERIGQVEESQIHGSGKKYGAKGRSAEPAQSVHPNLLLFQTHLCVKLKVHEDWFSKWKFGHIEVHSEEMVILSNNIIIIDSQLQHILQRYVEDL